jgi:hypothetical protein
VAFLPYRCRRAKRRFEKALLKSRQLDAILGIMKAPAAPGLTVASACPL